MALSIFYDKLLAFLGSQLSRQSLPEKEAQERGF